ncbi:hypothetical protein Slin14017_G111000 [Septoria linicola]|nr:hypothetical protein Slin14017_G111000 [Septoria linicola]
MSNDRNIRRTTNTRGRPLYAPPPPAPGSHNRNHSVLGYWVPLVTIGTIAVGGLAAWIWSERSEHDDDYPHDKPQRPPGPGGPYPTQGSQPYPGPPQSAGPNAGAAGYMPLQDPTQPPQPIGADVTGTSYGGGSASAYYDASSTTSRNVTERNDATFLGRVMRRTPSPQQFFDNASKQVMGGVAAAGKALGSIMEVDSRDHSEERRRLDEREGFSDHERWSEEAEDRQRIKTTERDVETSKRGSTKSGKGRAKRTVAIVVSADVEDHEISDVSLFHTEHGSILSHLPEKFDPELSDLFVLIYAPSLKALPSTGASSVLGSSYSNISTPAQTPGSELQSISPRIEATNPTFDNLQQQAQSLVDHPTKIMPFSTPAGYVSILRHLAPQIVYISDTLSGRDGETVAQLKGWVGHTVLVVGDEGHGGLADTETETETEDERKRQRKSEKRWWEYSSIVGLGKEIDVVDAMRVGDDWAKRVNGRE